MTAPTLRRACPRAESEDEIELLYPCYARGRVVNVSSTGMRVWAPRATTVGSVVGFRLSSARRGRSSGRVVWQRRTLSGWAIGIRFSER